MTTTKATSTPATETVPEKGTAAIETAIASRVKAVSPRFRRIIEDVKEAFAAVKDGSITQDHIDTAAASAKRFLTECVNTVNTLDAVADAVEGVTKAA